MINTIVLILAAALVVEAIYILFFIQMRVRRNTKRLVEVESSIENIHKLMVQILHLAHQMKTLQNDWNNLKKSGILKFNGNGHHKAHS